MAGNTGLWIGFTAITCGELVLIAIQVCFLLCSSQLLKSSKYLNKQFKALLWILCCPKELPEVPSCRRRNYPKRFDGFNFSDEEDSGDENEKSGRSAKVNPGPIGDGAPTAKIMANSLATDGPLGTRRATIPAFAIQYERVSRTTGDDHVPPPIVHSDNGSSQSVYF